MGHRDNLLVTLNLSGSKNHGCRPHPRGSVRRASGFVLTGKPYLIRSGKGRRQSTNWVISSELISVQFTQSGKIRKRKERSYENRGHYRKNPAGFDVSCLWA